jgi:hypothetical protein
MNLRRRIESLKERHRAETAPPEREAWDHFLKRLTTDELTWLTEPSDEAQSLVLCPHVEMVSCGCRGEERRRRGFEVHPELLEEYMCRRNTLLERTDEIMERAPE